MTAILVATLSAAAFSGASLLALLGGELTPKGRSYLVAIAAGILLSLAFGDLFPEGLKLADNRAVLGFAGGFSLLFLTESFTRAHTHHPPEDTGKHAPVPFVLGLAIHNLADGFVLGVSGRISEISAGMVGLGVFVHQVPVGISVAAVLAASRVARRRVIRTALLLGLAIPLASVLTLALPIPGGSFLGILTGAAG
ncbi:MAG: ZIP family metal transporter, partial [Actinomycetota bacterium]